MSAKSIFIGLLITFFFMGKCFSDYVDDILNGKKSLDSVVFEFYSSGKYSELYEILEKLSEATNSEKILFEKIKLGYSLGKGNVTNDIYEFLNSPSPNLINLILVIGNDEKILSGIGNFITSKGISKNTLLNYSKMCLLNNSLKVLTAFLTNTTPSEELISLYNEIIESLLQKLDYYQMYNEIVTIFYSYKSYIKFSEFEREIIANGLINLNKPDEALELISNVDSANAIIIRIKSLSMIGELDSALEESKKLRITGINARIVFLLFLNKLDLQSAKNTAVFLDESFRELSVGVISLMEGDIMKAEEVMKNILSKSYFDPHIRNLSAELIWVVNNSSDIDETKKLSLSILNRFAKIKNSNLILGSEQVEKIKKLEGYSIP